MDRERRKRVVISSSDSESDSETETESPPVEPNATPRKKVSAKKKRACQFQQSWLATYDGIGQSHRGPTFARCTYCAIDFTVSHGGKNDVERHLRTSAHVSAVRSTKGARAINNYFKQAEPSPTSLDAEARLAIFVAKHNIPFSVCDHISKLFPKMFPDSAIAKGFASARTKTTAVVKEALGPTVVDAVVSDLKTQAFGIMMDESNDRTDKSCIILVRMFDPKVRTYACFTVDLVFFFSHLIGAHLS